jgi:hypothetical protein
MQNEESLPHREESGGEDRRNAEKYRRQRLPAEGYEEDAEREKAENGAPKEPLRQGRAGGSAGLTSKRKR